MSGEISKIGESANDFTPEDVRKYLVSGDSPVTDKEVRLFLELCKAQGLNPWIKEAYLIKYNEKDPATIVTGKYVFTKKAAAHKDCAGWQSGVITENGGELKYHKGTVYPNGEKLVGGWVDIERHSWKIPMRKTVSLTEYEGKRWDKEAKKYVPIRSWKDRPATMIEKVAIVAGLREAFSDILGGLYDEDEMSGGTREIPERKTSAEVQPAPAIESKAGEEIKTEDENEKTVLLAAIKDEIGNPPNRDKVNTFALRMKANGAKNASDKEWYSLTLENCVKVHNECMEAYRALQVKQEEPLSA